MQRGDDYLLSHLFFLSPLSPWHLEQGSTYGEEQRLGRVYKAHTEHFVPESMCARRGGGLGSVSCDAKVPPFIIFGLSESDLKDRWDEML